MKKNIIKIAEELLDAKGMTYGKVLSSVLKTEPSKKNPKKAWVIEFDAKLWKTGIRIDNDHIIVLVDPDTLKVNIFETM
jgi:hypothetical protein